MVPESYLGFALLLGFLLAWLCWSFLVTKWRLWAFANVRNVHDLKEKAIQAQLIYPDDKWYGKTERRSTSEKLKWAKLEQKFKIQDVFEEVSYIPETTEILLSKSKVTYWILLGVFMAGIGVYALLNRASPIFGILFGGFGVYFIFGGMGNLLDSNVRILLSDMGIETTNTTFFEWSDIKNEKIVLEGSGKNQECYLTYDHPKGSESLSISDLDTDQGELEGLLRTYRIRYNNRKP